MIISPVSEGFKVSQIFWWNYPTYKRFWLKGHNWLDIATPVWTPVFAPFDWIIDAWNEWNDWYGKYIKITELYEWEKRQMTLWHLSKYNVIPWQKIKAWEYIWETGNTGFSTWAHLHITFKRLNADWSIKNINNWYKWSENIFDQWWLLQHLKSKY